MGYLDGMRGATPTSLVRQQGTTLREEDVDMIARRLRRIFLGCALLTVLIVILLLLAAPQWRVIPSELTRFFSAILLWSLVVTGYGVYSQFRVADMMKELLRERSFHDEVTGVFNYRYLDLRLAEEAERTRRNGGLTAVLYLDLDNFKRINDLHGHQTGNLVLKQLATMLSQKVRLCDVFGRVGGDEFLVVLPQTGRREAHVLGERLRDAVENYSLEVGDGKVIDFVRVSIGAAAFPVNGETIENVITAADNAVYEAKAQGGGRVAMASEFIRSDESSRELSERARAEGPAEGLTED